MGSSRFRSIFCGPNYVSPGLNRPCFAVSSGAVRARVHAHEHASKSTRSEHRSRGLRGGRVTAKYHQREREKKFHRRPLREPIQRPFNVSSIFLLQNKSISVFLSEKLIHFLSFFFFLFIEELGSRSQPVLFARRRERKSNSNRGGRVMTPRDSHLSPISNHYFSNWSLTLSLSCASLRRL